MNSVLGDYFPDDIKKQYSEDNLKIGTVLKAHVKDTTPPKEKRFIIVGISEDQVSLASVYINSELNINVFHTEELKKSQLLFEAKGREYLSKDSYIDCSKLIIKSTTEIKAIIENKPDAIIGFLEQEDFGRIKEAIRNNKTESIFNKKKFKLFY